MTPTEIAAAAERGEDAGELLEALYDLADWAWAGERKRAIFDTFLSIDTPEAYMAAAWMLLPEGWFLTGGGWCGVEGKGFGFGLQDQLLTSEEVRAQKRKGKPPTKWTGERYAPTPAHALIAAIARSVETTDEHQ